MKKIKLFEKIRFFIFIVIIFSFLFNEGYSQWKWVHPAPSGSGQWWCKMWDADTWYAAGKHGVFTKTTNAGDSWSINVEAGKRFSISTPYADILDAHFFNMNTGIIVGGAGMIAKTNNGGITFDTIQGQSMNGIWYGIYFFDNNTGYISGQNGSLAKTTDAGNTWVFNSSIPGGSSRYYDVYTPDDNLILVSSTSGNIHRSTDGGTSWTQINTGGSSNLYSMKFISKDTGFVAGTSNAFRYTTDGGISWTNRSPSPSDNWNDLTVKREGGNIAAYLTGNNFYVLKTTDFGLSWDTLRISAPGQTLFDDFRAAYILGSGDTIFAVGDNGMINIRYGEGNVSQITDNVRLRSDNSDVWADRETGKVWVVGDPETAGSTYDQVLYSSDRGNTWTYQSTVSSSADFYSISMLDVNTGYIAGSGGEVMKTTNGGGSWLPVSTPTTNTLRCVDFVNANTGWILGVSGTLYKTTDGGGSWSQQTCASTGNNRGSINMLDANTGWIAGGTGAQEKICKTTNGGINWIDQNVSVLSQELMDIKMLNANTGYASGAGVIRKTTNGGANWDALPYPVILGTQFLGLDFIDTENGVVCGLNVTLQTGDGGQSWVVQHGMDGSNYSRLHMVSTDTIFLAGDDAGIFLITDGVTGINTHWHNTSPERYELSQNYPNPFNPSTTIEFAIPRQGRVTLKVFDMAGREVSTLINGLELNPGTVKQTFDGSRLASGVYFYSLIVDNNVVGTKKMLLIK